MSDIDWTPSPNLNTDAVKVIDAADRLERRTKKPTHTVPVIDRLDEVMRERLETMFGAI